jgi:hypothetical protein
MEYISSAGMALLTEALERGEPKLVACGLCDSVRIAFELAGLSPRMPVAESAADALGRIAQSRQGMEPEVLRDEPVGSDN